MTISMNKKGRRAPFSVLAALIAIFISTLTLAQKNPATANEIVQKIQEFYVSVNDYKASFVQTTSHKMFAGRLQRAYGNVMFKKGGLMRWEYLRPEKKFFIWNAKVLWVYEPEVPQAFQGTADAERLSKALAFLTGEGRILDVYRAKKLDSKKFGFADGFVVGLWPKDQRSPFKRVEIYMDKETYRVVRSVVVDQQGNRNRLDFYSPKTNSGLSAGAFSFAPPPGVPIIQAK